MATIFGMFSEFGRVFFLFVLVCEKIGMKFFKDQQNLLCQFCVRVVEGGLFVAVMVLENWRSCVSSSFKKVSRLWRLFGR